MAKVPKMTQADVDYAKKELEAWRDQQRGGRLTWELFATATGFSRQTLTAHREIHSLYLEAKAALKTGARPRPPRSDDYFSQRIAQLEKELDRYKVLESDWLERWVRIAYYARAKRTSIEELDTPLPTAARK
jgi:hypothetical protein